MAGDDGRAIPASTYRLQFSRDFDFTRAAALVPYLARLGVDACYASPILTARPGSPHGYDIVDHGTLNPELGGDAGLRTLAGALRSLGLQLVLDFVPNHMAADADANRWWRDVLAHGQRSQYAETFDIDWTPLKQELRGRVLLPILDDHYGRVLERGELVLTSVDGAFVVRYLEQTLPIDPEHAARITGDMNGTPGDAASFDRLHELLELQAYRLAYWRVAGHEINYRRFFDVNELAAIRMERKDVFDATHARLAQLLADGVVQGVRVDHPDGLSDPETYFERLANLAGMHRPYLLAEKILASGERLPATWPIDGTTGYDFLNDVGGLFVDAGAGPKLHRISAQVAGRQQRLADVIYECKKLILTTSLSSELNVLADALNRLSEADRRSRDFTHHSLREALLEVVACFPVYRTYVSGRGCSEADVRAIDSALREARRRNRPLGRSIFEFLRCVLLPAGLPGLDADDNRFEPRPDFAERLRFSMAMQQVTAPVQAKGLEDTAFYRHNMLISLNEVGGEPARFGRSPVEFHASNAARLAEWPHGMLATSTHDTKLGEDTRLRVHAISELTDEWRGLVTRWQRLTSSARRRLEDGWAPEGNDVYRFYQALVGAWPAGQRGNPAAMEELTVRLRAYLSKALREAKARTSWMHQNEPYEAAVDAFVTRVLTGRRARRFLDAVEPFAERLAALGARYALSQLVLKLSSPGVADFYQGSELWTLTLVDPDNRSPIDFETRAAALDALAPMLEGVEQPDGRTQMADLESRVTELGRSWRDGRVKLYVTAAGLRLRRADRDLFLKGDYVPLEIDSPSPGSVVALARRFEDRVLIAVVPRLVASICPPGGGLATPCAWGDTRVWIPDALCPRDLVDVFTGRRAGIAVRQDGRAAISVASLLETFPVAWLWGRTTRF